jgi:hypothetical protein
MAVWSNNVFGFALPAEAPPPAARGLITLASLALAGGALWWAARPSER